mmetsp:Transcript_7527/g.12548  ORF Transcript_7527/g.12548 Transcript_7527/m.12548 type:complete len:431 (-) Transcript_7527:40-1332(-)
MGRATMTITPGAWTSLALHAVLLLSSIPRSTSQAPAAELFEPAPDAFVLGPSSFPRPTDKLEEHGAVPIVQPVYGKHRPEADAVFAYSEGYSVSYYLHFIESLRSTGFDGDLVLAIAEVRLLQPDVMEYLQTQSNLVVYHSDMDCLGEDQVTWTGRRVMKTGGMDIFQMCRLHEVYGWVDDADGKVLRKAQDPREGRVVATLRYEWYWIWLQHYNKNSWIMVVDARDSFFQLNPFADLPRHADPDIPHGRLWFFGENAKATRLGKSTKNANWLRNGYGVPVFEAMREKPTICSGSTMGEVVAMEQYLRALINEKDETEIKMTGSDQGFHNYLYYTHKLANVDAISSLTVWEQGRGAINNLGALRTAPLNEWGNYNLTSHAVTNWDGTLSPVVHQWDRDHDLHHYHFRVLFKSLQNEWEEKRKLAKGASAS